MHKQSQKRILVFIDWFLPGYRAGGPVRSMANMIEQLGNDYHFMVVTRNTDYMENEPYDLVADRWTKGPFNSEVYYFSGDGLSYKNMKQLLAQTRYDVAYINGIYSWWFSILPLILLNASKKTTKFSVFGKKAPNTRLSKFLKPRSLQVVNDCFKNESNAVVGVFLKRLLRKQKVIVGVRGMLADSAIDVKRGKKKMFLSLARLVGLYSGVVFHATNKKEALDIQSLFGNANIQIAPNLPRKALSEPVALSKYRDSLRLVSFARIAPEKNTLFALEALKQYGGKGKILFDLYGQIYDEFYWQQCKAVIDTLPSNISVEYRGMVESERVVEIIGHYHFLFLPSRGENFGHVVLESFSAARPVLISDQTPWRGLAEARCGYDLPLEHFLFAQKIGEMAELAEKEWETMCDAARRKAEAFCNDEGNLERYYRLLGD
jgi:glycosyltransferase involved in cell wall biosynthesis